MAKTKMDNRQFRKLIHTIEKDYTKKLEYLKARRERKYQQLFKRVKEESTIKVGVVVRIETTKRNLNSPFTPDPTISTGIIKEVIPFYDGTIQFKIGIFNINSENNSGFTLECSQSSSGTYYDTEDSDGIFQYSYDIKKLKSQKSSE